MTPPLPGQASTRADRFLALRRQLRDKRRSVPDLDRRAAERHAASLLGTLSVVLRARRMAVYLSVDGELDLERFIADAQSRHTQTFAPVIKRDQLRFAPLRRDMSLRTGRLGIPEPTARVYIDPRRLDVVLTPLVAFDDRGTRLGRGAGYYDRHFKFLATRSRWVKPKLIGIGYEFQRVRKLERRAWDIPLWAAVTERGIYHFGDRRYEK